MTQAINKRSAKTGLPPGALIHIGQRHTDRSKITLCRYDESHFKETEAGALEGLMPPPHPNTVTWIHIDGLQDVGLLAGLGSIFGLHPLILEDILNTDQRPKLEDHGDYLFIVLKRFQKNGADNLVHEQISLVLGPHYLISLQEKEGNLLEPIRKRLRDNHGRLRKVGAEYLAHAILDRIVDDYFDLLDLYGEQIESLEESLMGNPSPDTLRSIRKIKREIIMFRKSVWPLREMMGNLDRSDSPLIKEQSTIYFRDITDHTVQVIDTIETYRDILSGMLDIYLSTISNRTNEVMKVLTVIATIFMPLTFLVGIYGMNFKYMPELDWTYGYFILWFLMFIIAVCMLFFFKRKKWL